MKKSVCILACALTLALTGCQTKLERSDAETNSSAATSNSSFDLDNISESNTVNDDTNSGQVGGKDDNEADVPYDDDFLNTDAGSDQNDSKDNSGADNTYNDDLSNTNAGKGIDGVLSYDVKG